MILLYSGSGVTEKYQYISSLTFSLSSFSFLKIEHGTKYAVPDGSAYAKTFVIIFIVMQVMIPPERLHPFERRVPGMDSVVHGTIYQITQYEAGEKNERIIFHHQVHDSENRRRDDEAGHRWHKQPFLIAGEVMMVTMHHIYKFLGSFTIRNGMKGETMHQVFKKRPEKSLLLRT